MSLCEFCEEGQLEMCDYFKEHFLESGAAVRNCPKFRAEMTAVEVIRGGYSSGEMRIQNSRCIQEAAAGEHVLVLTKYPAAHGCSLLDAVADSVLKEKLASIHINFVNGGEIAIGGAAHADQ